MKIEKLSPKYINETSKLIIEAISNSPYFNEKIKKYCIDNHTTDELEKKIKQPNQILLISLSENDEVIGFREAELDDGGISSDLWAITRKDVQNQGIAKKLTFAIEDEARKLGSHRMYGEVIEGNEKMRKLLESCGWNFVINLPNNWFGQDYYLYTKKLD